MAGDTALPARRSYGPWLPVDVAWSAAIISTAVIYYLIGPTLPSLLLLAVLAFLVWRRSDLATTLVPLAVPLFTLPKTLILGRHLEFSLGETVIVLCAVIVLLQQLLTASTRPPGVSLRTHFLPESVFNLPALAFLAAAALATVLAHFHTVALREWREVVLEPILYYWLILQRVRGSGGAARLALAVVLAGIVYAVLGAAQLAFRPQDLVHAVNIVPPQNFVSSVYENENNLALLIDRAVPMALALALFPAWLAPLATGGGLFAGPRAERFAQAALLIGSAVMLAILYRTGSRGGEVTAALCLAILFFLWQRRRPAVLGAGAAVLAVIAFLGRHRLASAAGGHGLSNAAHQGIWETGLRMLRDHPIFGVGPDNFLYYYSDDEQCAPGHIAHWYYDNSAHNNFERCISHPHNLFLDLWLSTGLLGLLAGLALLALFAKYGLTAYLRSDPAWRGPLLASLIAVLALVSHGQVDNSYFLPDLSVLFWLCLGIVALWERQPSA